MRYQHARSIKKLGATTLRQKERFKLMGERMEIVRPDPELGEIVC